MSLGRTPFRWFGIYRALAGHVPEVGCPPTVAAATACSVAHGCAHEPSAPLQHSLHPAVTNFGLVLAPQLFVKARKLRSKYRSGYNSSAHSRVVTGTRLGEPEGIPRTFRYGSIHQAAGSFQADQRYFLKQSSVRCNESVLAFVLPVSDPTKP
jgi:hypothetical protein